MNAKTKPDWAPDNCPDAVAQLIAHDDLLSRLKLRGLASANGKDVHRATERLKHLLTERYREGWADAVDAYRHRRPRALLAGFAIGVATVTAVLTASALLAG